MMVRESWIPSSLGQGWVGLLDDVAANWRRLYSFVLKQVRDPHLSEDIAQETMTRLVAYQNGRSVANPQALGHTIALNLVRDHFRLRRPTAPLDDALPAPLPRADDMLIHRQKLEAVQAVIARMPPMRREVFIRRRVDGESLADISASLEISAAAVEKHLVRGLADLHAALQRTPR